MNILQMLQGGDPAYLSALAEVWGVRFEPRADVPAMIDALFKGMTDPARAEVVWDGLDAKARGALQMLISSGGSMPEARFVRIFGDIRRLGEGAIKREKPHQHPQSAAEALYYRGLIGTRFENADEGPRTIVIAPPDLVAVLPLNKTSYSNLSAEEGDDLPADAAEAEESRAVQPIDAARVQGVKPADTTLVDDMTTLLAYLRLHTPLLDGDSLSADDVRALEAHLLVRDAVRLRFLLLVGVAGDLIEVANGRAAPSRTGAPKWLGRTRHEQVRALAEAWRGATVWVDLWQVPGLYIDVRAGSIAQYNPIAARTAMLESIVQFVPTADWWSVDAFIDMVREENPDFQRPNADFNSWYIYDEGGALLTGIENWDAVEGALLSFVITSPLHWLGLLDRADGAARLSAYGRAFFGLTAYPAGAETHEPPTLHQDGRISVTRKASRADRYQIARFANWMSAGNTYVYQPDRASIARADAQGITAAHISAFLKRLHGDKPLPDGLARLVEGRSPSSAATAAALSGAPAALTQVTLERAIVLRTTAPETLDVIVNTPELRRFTGARLGEMAVMVLKNADLEAFSAALAAHGITAELIGG
jgi:hypothetical protein